ncbi:alpha/beta fold hydrolase [Miltoncostaea marina]|uniref:alpha/beta fold hydrolase n=1 Tax=Miltoncostaea marina TaxID=2843215 RepID=UPI001C3D9466|nr:alpha/beta hydrolase [Miltoncostaea marina]
MPLPGLAPQVVDVGGSAVALSAGGEGPPLLLLHGYPQTRACWHKVAPGLAERFTVVAADLRGYGDSAKPPGDPAHERYSKRAMAGDLVGAMRALGHERFAVAGHDRGGRVAHRMALDHPDVVTRAAVLDIVPTRTLFARTDQAFATAYYHWFFLIQPDGLPETMIGRDPEWFLRETLRRWSGTAEPLDESAIAGYVRAFSDPAAIHASCEDYRAAASIDLEHDAADAGARVRCPLLVLWGEQGRMHALYDVLAAWREVADDVRGRPVPGGHFCPEEAPRETLSELLAFFAPVGAD